MAFHFEPAFILKISLFLKDGSSASTTVIQASPTFNDAPPPSLSGGALVAVSNSTSLLSMSCTPSTSTEMALEPDALGYEEPNIPTQVAYEVNMFYQY